MNIKEHIEAEHYPKDDKGRSIVPTNDCTARAIIVATDAPGSVPLIGWVIVSAIDKSIDHTLAQAAWNVLGQPDERSSRFLLPPEPKKVTVTVWVRIDHNGKALDCTIDPKTADNMLHGAYTVIGLSKEIEL